MRGIVGLERAKLGYQRVGRQGIASPHLFELNFIGKSQRLILNYNHTILIWPVDLGDSPIG